MTSQNGERGIGLRSQVAATRSKEIAKVPVQRLKEAHAPYVNLQGRWLFSGFLCSWPSSGSLRVRSANAWHRKVVSQVP